MPGCAGTAATWCLCAVAVRGDPQGPEDTADGGCADPVAELEQFALDPLVSPAVVLGGEPLDQRGDLGADRRPSCPVGVGPLPGGQAAVPPQDDAGRRRPAGQPRRAERPHLVLRVGAQPPYRERLVLPEMSRRFAALEQTSHSPEPPLQPSAHRPSARHAPGEGTGPPDGHTGCTPDSATTSSRTHPRTGHPRAMRGPDPGQQAATHTAPWPLCPWIPATQGSIALQGDTRRDREETAPHSRKFAASGPFSQDVAGGGFEPPKA